MPFSAIAMTGLLLVVFQELGPPKSRDEAPEGGAAPTHPGDAIVEQLESELRTALATEAAARGVDVAVVSSGLQRRAQRLVVERGEIRALEQDAAARRPLELQDAAPGGGLAAARLADKSHRLPAAHEEAHVFYRAHHGARALEHAAAHREMLDEVLHLEEHFAHAARPLMRR